MAPNSESLPEGTDTIVSDTGSAGKSGGGSGAPPPGTTFEPATTSSATGANGDAGPPAGTSFEPASSTSGTIREKFAEKTAGLRDQATDKARDLANQGKAKAVSTLDDVVRLVDDAAGTIDKQVGDQYGDYARRAAQGISGFASTLRNKDVDDLARDARDFVRKSPAIAIGAAAAVGFLIARIVKSASGPAGGDTAEGETGETAAPPTAPSVPDRTAG